MRRLLLAVLIALAAITLLPGLAFAAQPSSVEPLADHSDLSDQAAVPTFTDLGPSDPWYAAVRELAQREIVVGYPDRTFRPNNPVLRAQFAKMLDGAFALTVLEEAASPFTDLGPDVSASLYPHEYVAVGYGLGIIKGTSATTFSPYRNLSRAQAVTLVVRALGKLHPTVLKTPPANYVSHWGGFSTTHAPAARTAEYNGLLQGLDLGGTARDPWAAMPRGEVAQVLWNAMQKPILVVSGRVTSTSGTALAGVDVWRLKAPPVLWDGTATSGADGGYRMTFRLADLDQGDRQPNQQMGFWLRTKNTQGYVDVYYRSAPVLVSRHSDGDMFWDVMRTGSAIANFALAKGLSITGTVRSSQGEPVVGAEVLAGIATPRGQGQTATTGADGRYWIGGLLASDNYSLSVSVMINGVMQQVYSDPDLQVQHDLAGVDVVLTP